MSFTLEDDARRWQLSLSTARSYQQFIVPIQLQPWAEKLVRSARLSRNCRVLDLACGTGVAARIAAKSVGTGGEIVGVDRNAPMLSIARSLEPVRGAQIRWRLGKAEALHFPDHSFDAVLCHQGFQFFDDRMKAALEIARVLRPGGRLALAVWCGWDRNPVPATLISALQNRGYPTFSSAMQWPFSVQNRREITRPITRARFRVLAANSSRLWIFAGNAGAFLRGFLRSMPFGGAISEADVTALMRDSISALASYIHRDALRVPSQAHTIIAVRPTALSFP
jgi:ubiquinone/menaquinone biosynthesis C-methylase UbiE